MHKYRSAKNAVVCIFFFFFKRMCTPFMVILFFVSIIWSVEIYIDFLIFYIIICASEKYQAWLFSGLTEFFRIGHRH